MSTWNESPEIYTTDNGKESRCQICGNKPDALWASDGFIIICCKCAFKTLPKLMADAVCNNITSHPINKHLQISAFKAMWKEAEKNYWYAVAYQLLLAAHKEGEHEHN